MDETQATNGAATAAPANPAATDQTASPASPASGGSPSAPAQAGAAQAVETTPEKPKHYLDTADVNEIRSHPRFQGIVGDAVDKALRRIDAERSHKMNAEAAAKAAADLEEMAKRDPEAFAERYLNDTQRNRMTQQIQKLQQDARGEIAQMVGRSFNELPEWGALTNEDHERLAKAVQGKPDDEVIAAYNRAAIDLLAEKRIAAQVAEGIKSFREKELPKERESLRKEVAAELLKKEPRPDMSRSGRVGAFDPGNLSDEDFNKWYTTEGPGKDLGLVR